MSYWILPTSGIPMSCVTVQRLANLEQQTPKWKKKMENFDSAIETSLDINPPPLVSKFNNETDSNNQLTMTPDKEVIEE